MSVRHFARAFAAEVGTTPARWVAAMRLETARRSLEQSRDPLKSIAADAGYASVESLRRAFHAALRTTPGDYRRHFQDPRPEMERHA
jgi:transcriptional regulator GlxA family with amidase domain